MGSMNPFVDRVQHDLIQALKAKDAVTASTLRTFKAALQKVAIEYHGELSDEQVLAVLKTEIKKRQDSIVAYQAGNRPELAAQEEAELAVLKQYQPAQLSPEALEQKVREVVAQATAKDFGPLMGQVMQTVNGAADGKAVQGVLKKILAE